MYPSRGIHLDVEAVSGILGSISIACWVVVFSPQIIENFRRRSADGLSLVFIVVWLAGDIFNILGAVMQGVLPTMIILAVYYTLADIVLLAQCFYYRGFTLSDAPTDKPEEPVAEAVEDDDDDEDTPLLNRNSSPARYSAAHADAIPRRGSGSSLSQHLYSVDGTHLSPATPLVTAHVSEAPAVEHLKPKSAVQTLVFNTVALVVVCAAGVLGWWLSTRAGHRGHLVQRDNVAWTFSKKALDDEDDLHFDVLGQVFGYFCAVLYLGSRLPQLLLNYRRKSTEGVSMLFFLFACVGNLTYVLSIFAYEPACAKMHTSARRCRPGEWNEFYGRYILVNLSWLIGSAGTLFLDMGIFAQFWIYRNSSPISLESS